MILVLSNRDSIVSIKDDKIGIWGNIKIAKSSKKRFFIEILFLQFLLLSEARVLLQLDLFGYQTLRCYYLSDMMLSPLKSPPFSMVKRASF
jgi:hypothetical protein